LDVGSPMLVAVGMYLPFNTTSAIFAGGVIRWISDRMGAKRGHNEAQRTRVESVGVLIASGLIAGEALIGLVFATFRFFNWPVPVVFQNPSYLLGAAILVALGAMMI